MTPGCAAGRVLSGAEGAPLKGLTWPWLAVRETFFSGSAPGFPLEGISLRLCDKTLYKEQPFYFTPTAPTAAELTALPRHVRSRAEAGLGTKAFSSGSGATRLEMEGIAGAWTLLWIVFAACKLGMLGF